MTTQLAVKLSDGMAERIDELVKEGRFANRTDAVRAALDRMLEEIREEQTTAAILDGYRRIPQTDAEVAWAEAAARAMVLEEPWQ